MTVKSRSFVRHIVSIAAVVMMYGALVFACADTKRINGEECIKSEDCQSNICTGQKCTAAPPILDRDAGPADAPSEATDGGDGGDGGDAGSDATTNDATADASDANAG